MYYLCYIRKRDYKSIKLNDMKISSQFKIIIKCESAQEVNKFNKLLILLYEMLGVSSFYNEEDQEYVVDFLDKKMYDNLNKLFNLI